MYGADNPTSFTGTIDGLVFPDTVDASYSDVPTLKIASPRRLASRLHVLRMDGGDFRVAPEVAHVEGEDVGEAVDQHRCH